MNHHTASMNDSALCIPFRILVIVLLVLLSNYSHVSFAQDASPTISLSQEERTWLESNPEITLGYADSQEPQLIVNPDGSYSGIVVDLLDELNRRLGTSIKLAAFPDKELISKATKREIGGILNLHPGYADRLEMLKTKGYFQNFPALFASRDLVFNGPEDIPGKTVAIIDKVYFSEKLIKEYENKATIKRVTSALEGLQSLQRGEADLFIGVSHNSYFLSKYQLYDIAVKYIYTDYSDRTVIAVRPDWPLLVGILNKGLSSFSVAELKQIVARWVRLPEQGLIDILTAEDREWLAAHTEIVFGYTDVFEPELIVNSDGSYRGILVDFLALLNQRLGTDFKLTVKPIPDLIQQVSNKELPGVLAIHPDYADKLGWLRTQSYSTSYPAVFSRKGVSFNTPADLAGKKIALIDKVFFSQNLVDLYGSGSTLIKVEDALEGLEYVKDGTADLFIGSSTNSYLLGKYRFFDIAVTFQFYNHPILNSMGVRNDWPQLVSILNKGLASISVSEVEAIYRKWVLVPERIEAIELTAEEQAWLKENPRIGVGVSPLPPYQFLENGRVKGYLVDMMDRLVNQVGLSAEYSTKPIDKNLSRVKSGELHTILGVIHNEERAGFMYFSENTMDLQMSIFAGTSRSDISDAASLADKVIASFKGYGFEPVIKKFFPNATIIQADDTEGMLRLVASGEADAAVQELYSGEYILRNSFINGVSRKGSFASPGLPLMTGSEFAVSKKYPLLHSILNKAYNALPESEKTRVWRKWFANVQEKEKTISLTAQEQTWLREHPEIRFAFSADYPPGLIVDEDGHLSGQFKDVIDLLNQRLGSNFGITVAEIKAVREMVANKEVAGQLALTAGNGASRGLLETDVLWETYPVIYAPKDSPMKINALEDLKGKAVSTLKGSRYAEKILAPYQDKIDIVRTDTIVEAFRLLYEGKVDYMIGLTSQAYFLTKMRFLTLEPAFVMTDRPTKIVMGVRDDWPKLVEILNKGLKSITEDEWLTINNKWLETPDVIRPQLSLTLEEQAWLQKNPAIQVALFPLAPYMMEEDGKSYGYLVELFSAICQQSGLKTDFTMQSMAETLTKVEGQQAHAVLGVIHTKERSRFLEFSAKTVEMQMGIFGRAEVAEVSDIKSLRNKRIASYHGYGLEPTLRQTLPDAQFVRADDAEGMLRLVAAGKADVAVQEIHSGEYILRNHLINGVTLKGTYESEDVKSIVVSRFAVGKDYPLLKSILDKANVALPESTKQQIWNKWFVPDAAQRVVLTPEEQAWLAENNIVRVRATDWPPYMIINENKPPQGITLEYLKLIEERTGINFEYEVTKQPFAEFLTSMKEGQGPDMTAIIAQSPERKEYLSFSTPYIFAPYVIFTREQDEIFLDINDLAGKTVAVIKGHVIQQFLEKDFPEIELLLFDNDEQVLRALSTGNADAYIGNLTVATHIIQKSGLSNLRVVASTPYGDQSLSMGNRKDWPELTSIMNKVLAGITEEEKTAINNKYIALKYEQGLDKRKVVQWILSILAMATAILLLFGIWNRQLAGRVRLRTKELQETVKSLATEVNERLEVEKELIAKEAEELALINAVDNSFFLMETDGTIVVANQGLAERYGKELSALVGTNAYDYLPENIAKKRREHISRAISSGQAYVFEDELSGLIFEHRLYPVKDDSGVEHKLAVFTTDITERKKAEERIHNYQKQLKSLASQLTLVEQEERRRIAAGLHDHIGQILAFSRLQLARAQKKADDEDQQVLLNDISQSLLQVIEDTKELIFDLSSPLLNEIGLDAAITDWLENQVKNIYGLEYSYRQNNLKIELNELERTILFRNFKELVVNVVKHAKASRIEVDLEGNDETVFLTVTDNGLGFDSELLGMKTTKEGGFGLFSIQESMADIGGTLEIDSGREKGSTITMSIPVYLNERELSK